MPIDPAQPRPVPARRPPCCEIRTVIPATFEAIEHVFEGFRRNCKCILDLHDCFAAELLLREALTNAVVHGSQASPERLVRCGLRMRGNRLLIAIEDGGNGFDWRAIRFREADLSACSGRGMQILRTYATRVRFNAKGNAVAIIKDF